MDKKWPTHLFEYRYEGATWTIELPARSEADAKQRVEQLQSARYLGVLQMKIPVELGIFARLICWWQNQRATRT